VEVELVTSRFLYGPVPEPDGYRVSESFYRRTTARGLAAPGRRAMKAAEHLVDLARFRRRSETPDITHHQWFTFPALDPWLLPRRRPQLATAHYILPPRPSRRQILAARSAYARMDAVIAHSEQ